MSRRGGRVASQDPLVIINRALSNSGNVPLYGQVNSTPQAIDRLRNAMLEAQRLINMKIQADEAISQNQLRGLEQFDIPNDDLSRFLLTLSRSKPDRSQNIFDEAMRYMQQVFQDGVNQANNNQGNLNQGNLNQGNLNQGNNPQQQRQAERLLRNNGYGRPVNYPLTRSVTGSQAASDGSITTDYNSSDTLRRPINSNKRFGYQIPQLQRQRRMLQLSDKFDPTNITSQLNIGGVNGSLPSMKISGYSRLGPLQQNFMKGYSQASLLNKQMQTTNPFGLTSQNSSLMSTFPGWAMGAGRKMIQAIQKQKEKTLIQEKVLNRNDPQMMALQGAYNDPFKVSWQRDKWTGSVIDALAKKKDVSRRYIDSFKKNQALLNTKLSPQQVIQSVPAIVQQLVNSNAELSKYGIGAITNGGIPLYAGRWLDTTTGRIRIFPNASGKDINPLNYAQNRGLRQAKILNHWNNFVNSVQSYKNFISTVTPDILTEKFEKKALNATDLTVLAQAQKKKMVTAAQNALLFSFVKGATKEAFWNLIPPRDILTLYSVGQEQNRDLRQINQTVRQYVMNTIMQQKPNERADMAQWQVYNKLYNYAISLVDVAWVKQRNMVKSLARVISIPQNATPMQLTQTADTLKQFDQRVQKMYSNENRPASLTFNQIMNAAKSGKPLGLAELNKYSKTRPGYRLDMPDKNAKLAQLNRAYQPNQQFGTVGIKRYYANRDQIRDQINNAEQIQAQ